MLARPATSLGMIRGSPHVRTPDYGTYSDKKSDVQQAMYGKRAPVRASSTDPNSEMSHRRSTEVKHSIRDSEPESQHGKSPQAGPHSGGDRNTSSGTGQMYHITNYYNGSGDGSRVTDHAMSGVGPNSAVKMVKRMASPSAWKGTYDINMRVELLRLVDDAVKTQGTPKDLGRVQGRAPVRRFGGRPKSPR